MKQRKQRTDAFNVKTASGKTYAIEEFTHQIYQEFLNPADNGWANGLKEFHVVGGGRANRKSSTEYEIVQTGEIAVRV